MCGIAGYIGTADLGADRVRECMRQMRRRGPDAAAEYRRRGPTGQNVVLLHARLSIIDLGERSNQPFRHGSRLLAYNGELYNYVELRDELTRAGARFLTSGDTEVMAASLAREGAAAALERCEGMWALAEYDETDGGLLLSRDRFGEKPLYLYRDDTGLYFGSETKFIFALLGRKLPINRGHLIRYLVHGYKALYKTRETFFEGLSELEAGSFLEFGGHRAERISRYWTPKVAIDDTMNWDQAVEKTRDALVRSVKLRLRADVPLAFCMSGGVDSNALIAIAKNVCGYDVHGFTIVNTDSRYEEKDLVEHSVQELGIRHTNIHLDKHDFLPRFRELVRQHDAPVYTITYYTHWLLMQSIHEHGYKISVSGTAADELFSGYYDHHLLYLAMTRGDLELHKRSVANWSSHIKPIVRNRYLRDPDVFLRNPALRDHIFMDASDFAGYLTKPWSEPFEEHAFTPDLLRNRMLNEIFHEIVPPLLHEDDLNAMYYSVENRSPFLDRGLFDVANSVPTRHLVRDGMAKAVLRHAMMGIAPEKIMLNRRKVGFNAPIHDLLDTSDASVRAELLNDSPIFELLKRERIAQILNKHRSEITESENKFIFYYISAKIFIEEFYG